MSLRSAFYLILPSFRLHIFIFFLTQQFEGSCEYTRIEIDKYNISDWWSFFVRPSIVLLFLASFTAAGAQDVDTPTSIWSQHPSGESERDDPVHLPYSHFTSHWSLFHSCSPPSVHKLQIKQREGKDVNLNVFLGYLRTRWAKQECVFEISCTKPHFVPAPVWPTSQLWSFLVIRKVIAKSFVQGRMRWVTHTCVCSLNVLKLQVGTALKFTKSAFVQYLRLKGLNETHCSATDGLSI